MQLTPISISYLLSTPAVHEINPPCYFLTADFAVGTVIVNFLPGEISKEITVAVTNDVVAESTEEFSLFLQNPSTGSMDPFMGTAKALIFDDDSKRTQYSGNNMQSRDTLTV